jgi:HK97 family phage prohead protease
MTMPKTEVKMGLKQLDRRFRPLDTGRREVQLPVDSLGRERYRANIDARSIERRDDGDPIGFKGHAALFNKPTWIGPKRWGFREQVAPGAFAKTIKEADVRFLINHDPNLLLARNKAGTLTLSEDKQGLATEADMAPVSYAQDLAILLDRGDISQMSFAFETVKDQWEIDDDENELRTILEARLWDVSVVTYPAYEDTDAGLRGAAFDVLCRSAGLDEESRSRLLLGLTGDEDDDINPILRAAGTALVELTREPADATRDDTDDQPAETTGTPLSIRQLRHSLRASQLGLSA